MANLLGQWRSRVKGPQSFAANYIKQGNEQQVEANVLEGLKRLDEPRFAALKATPEGQAFVAEVQAWAEQARRDVKAAAATKAVDGLIRQLQSNFRFYERHVQQKNERSMASCKQTCVDILEKNASAWALADAKAAGELARICGGLGLPVPATSGGAAPAAAAVAAPAGAAAAAAAAPQPKAATAPSTAAPVPAPTGPFDQAQFDAVKKLIAGDLRWMKSNPNLTRKLEHQAKVRAAVEANLAVLQAEAAFLQEINAALAELDSQVAAGALVASRRQVESEKRWVETHLKRGAQDSVLSARDSLVKALETNREVLLRSPEGQLFLQEMSAYLADVGTRFEQLKLSQEGEGLVRRGQSEMRWVTTHLGRKDTNSASRAWERLQDVVEPLLPSPIGPSRYAGLESVEKFVTEYDALAARVDQEISSIVRDGEVDGLSRRADSTKHWVDSYLKNGEPKRVMEHVEALQGIAAQLNTYVGHAKAEMKAKEVQAIIEDARAKLLPIIEKQQVEAITRPASQTLYWLKNALEQKNEDKCILLREQLVDRIAPLRERFGSQPDALKFIGEVDALLATMEDQLGAIIAEKDSLRLLRAAESSYRWLETSIGNKDIRRTQLYLEQLQPQLHPLKGYEATFPNVAEFLRKAQTLLGRVDGELGALLAEAEVDSLTQRIKTPLSFFQSALNSRDPNAIVPRRQRLVEATVPLRSSRHNAHPKAVQSLSEVDAALAKCDSDMSAILGDAATSRVAAKVRSHLSWAKGAAGGNDTRGALLNLQKAHEAVQPLRTEHPQHAAAMALVAEADAATQALGAQIGEAMHSQEGTDMLARAAPILADADRQYRAGQLVGASAALSQANTASAPLRARFGFRPDVQKHLFQLDSMCVALLGGVPREEEAAPQFEIDWRLPVAIQDVLKRCNTEFAGYNALMGAQKREARSELDFDGRKRLPGDYWLENLEKSCERAKAHVSEVTNKHLPALAAAAPDHPALAMSADMAPRLVAMADELKMFARPVYKYCEVFHDLREGYKSPLRGYTVAIEAAQRGDRDNEPELWGRCIDSLKATIAQLGTLAAAAQQLPEGYDNTSGEMFGTELEGLLIGAEGSYRLACLKWHKLAAQESDLWAMDKMKEAMAARYAGCEEEKELLALHDRVSTILAEEAAKAAEEARLERERAAREAAERLAKATAVWLDPFVGNASVPISASEFEKDSTPDQWQWCVESDKSCSLKNLGDTSGGTYEYHVKEMVVTLVHSKGEIERGLVSFKHGSTGEFGFRSEYKGYSKIWASYSWEESSSSFKPTSDALPVWKYSAGKLTAEGSASAKGFFQVTEFSFPQPVPAPAVLLAAIAPAFHTKIHDWVQQKDKEIAEAKAKAAAAKKYCGYWPTSAYAFLCSNCAFGSNADNCGVCGSWPTDAVGRVCSDHHFGSNETNCKKCGNWEPNEDYRKPFRLCTYCSISEPGKDNCCATF